MSTTKYVCWKRSDGMVNCSANHMPRNWVTFGVETSFEHLKTFDNWDSDTIEYLTEQRALSNYKELV